MLDKHLQDDASLLKWSSQYHLGVYVGQSPHHASNVPLVDNPKTGHMGKLAIYALELQGNDLTGSVPSEVCMSQIINQEGGIFFSLMVVCAKDPGTGAIQIMLSSEWDELLAKLASMRTARTVKRE